MNSDDTPGPHGLLRQTWNKIRDRLRTSSGTWMGGFILGVGLSVIAIGQIRNHGLTFSHLFDELYANLGVDFFGIAVVVLVVDRLSRSREGEALKHQLTREMSSSDHGLAARAVLELGDRGWLADGTMRGAPLSGSNLSHLRMERIDLSNANLAGANLIGSNLSRAKLRSTNFSGAKMRDVNLEMANLEKSNMQDADLERADMAYAVLTAANLAGAILQDADLSNSNLSHADLRNADVTGCRFNGASLDNVMWDGAKGLTLIEDGEERLTGDQSATQTRGELS